MEPNNLYHIYKPFSVFVSRMQLVDYMWTDVVAKTGASALRAWGMVGHGEGGKELLLTWIQDGCYTWAHQSSGEKCQQWNKQQITITGCSGQSGEYYLESESE